MSVFNGVFNISIGLWRIGKKSFGRMKLLSFSTIDEVDIEFGGKPTKHLFVLVFENVGKDILSLCFGLVSHTTKKVLHIVGLLRQQQKRRLLRRTSKYSTTSWNLNSDKNGNFKPG